MKNTITKDAVWQDVKIAIFALLSICFLLLTVLACLPERVDVEVREAFTASVSVISITDGTHRTEASGTLRNVTGEDLTVEKLTVKVGDVELVGEDLPIPARSSVPVTLAQNVKPDGTAVKSVSVTLSGEEYSLRNPAVGSVFSYALLPFLLLLLFLGLTAHAVIVRIYIGQEKKIPG